MKISLKILLFVFVTCLVCFVLPIHSLAMKKSPQQEVETNGQYQDTNDSILQEDKETKELQPPEGFLLLDKGIEKQPLKQTQGAKRIPLSKDKTPKKSLPIDKSAEEEKRIVVDPSPPPGYATWQLIVVIVVPIIIISSLLMMFYFRRKDGSTSGAFFENSSFADIAVNDAAIGSSDYDQLGTSVLAKGISLFLCNRETIPPITLAVTGEWGSGKSSVMGMLMGYLKDACYRPIWFNAWHHHNEEHMFGALLETIRQEAVPPIWSSSGLSFRVRLLARRAWRHPLITTLLLSGISFFVLFCFLSGLSPLDIYGKIFDNKNSVPRTVSMTASILIPLIGFFTVLTKGLTAFGLSPGLLFRKMSHSFKSTGVNADPGLRYRINQYLDDITWALSNRTLVVFIDDLDRCPPDQVLKALECANFLSSNPRRSYIVLGMALDKVLPSISGEFNYVVEEALEEKKRESERQRSCRLKEERLAYAKNYLEKMINMEIHIPKAPVEKIKNLADSRIESNKLTESNQDKSNRFIRLIDQRVFPLLLLSFMLFGIIAGGDFAANQYYNNDKLMSEQNSEANGQVSAGNTSTGNSIAVEYKPIIPNGPWKSYWWICLEILVSIFGVIVFAYYYISKKTEVKDKPGFIEALKLWTQIIIINNKTPRHFKRAVNQLRLLAMRIQIDEGSSDQGLSQDDQIVKFIVLKALRDLGVDLDIELGKFLDVVTEDFVTNLSGAKDSIEECIKELTTIIKDKIDVNRLFISNDDSNIETFAKVIIDHQSRFPGQWPNKEDVDRYKALMTGITLR